MAGISRDSSGVEGDVDWHVTVVDDCGGLGSEEKGTTMRFVVVARV